MGYKIIYSKVPPKKASFFRFQALTAAFMLLFVLGIKTKWPAAAQQLRQVLVSGELSRGAVAVIAMVQELEQGETVSDAVDVFCQEVFGER